MRNAVSIYKILRQSEWHALQSLGSSNGSPDDIRDGYVHLSKAAQVPRTLVKHFAGEDGLWLLEIEEGPLGQDLRWEKARGGDLFPHLYRALELREVQRAEPILKGQALPFGLS